MSTPLHAIAAQVSSHPLEEQRLLSTAEAAKFLNRAEITLRIARIRGNGPAYRKFGRTVRYTIEDLIAYVEQSKRTSTSQAA